MPNTRTDTFTNYLRRQRHRSDRVGDFARDWLADTSGDEPKPRGRFTWRSVRVYLERSRASEPAILAARKAWSEWLGTPPDPALYQLPKLLVHHGILPPDALENGVPESVSAVIRDLASALTPPID